MRFYGRSFEFEEYLDYVKIRHTTFSVMRRGFVERGAYVYFIGDAVVIPECDDPDRLIEEYRPKFAFILVSYQSHSHPVSFNNHRRDVFILNNKVWRPYAPNVIPKIVFSSTEDDRLLFFKHFRRQ